MIYRKDLFEKSGIEIPTTLEEMVAAGEKLKADNADTPNFSGIYLPGRNWYAALSFIWEHGGDIATKEGDQWVGQLDSAESIAGLEFFKDLFDRANAAPADSDDANDYLAFCAGEVGMMPAPGWKPGQILNEDDGCPDMEANIGVFPMPGSTAPLRPRPCSSAARTSASPPTARTRTWRTTCSRSWCRAATRSSSPSQA